MTVKPLDIYLVICYNSIMDQLIKDIKETMEPIMEKWVKDRVAHVESMKRKIKSDRKRICKVLGIADNRMYSKSVYDEIEGLNFKNCPWSGEWYQEVKYYMTMKEIDLLRHTISESKKHFKRQAEQKLLKIDVAVAKKFDGINTDGAKVEIIQATPTDYDGFASGSWKITTKDKKEYMFSFEMFTAGGYNIQCWHVRTKCEL